MNPLSAAHQLQGRLTDYIRFSLPIEKSVHEFTPHVEKLFAEHKFAKAPYLELMTGYKAGESLQELAEDGVIHAETASIFAKAFLGADTPEKFFLYTHQANAIRAVCGHGKNLIVCSGTGSGKTETFLIPLVDYLVRQWDAEGRPERLSHGVRAMLLYPMNALVNDQIRRLRQVLKHADFITFGKYIGELEHESDLKESFRDIAPQHRDGIKKNAQGCDWTGLGFDDEAALKNERTTRSSWQKSPAHILVTNYSMLERLLIEPGGSMIFGADWKFIILDEAHCYTGAVGTEIAWLVRRVKRRVEHYGCPPGQLRFLATSATLISGQQSQAEKRTRIQHEFAARLFPAPANSFDVQFGDPETWKPAANAWKPPADLEAGIYSRLLDTPLGVDSREAIRKAAQEFPGLLDNGCNTESELFSYSQLFLGAEQWLKKLKSTCADLDNLASGPIAAGDACYLLEQAAAALASPVLNASDEHKKALERDFLDSASAEPLRAVLSFLEEGIAEVDVENKQEWRDYLHNPADPKPSSIADDNDSKGRRRRRGNRLHVLREWQSVKNNATTASLTFEGLPLMIETATELAASVAEEFAVEIEPRNVRLGFNEKAQAAFRELRSIVESLSTHLKTIHSALIDDWSAAIEAATHATPPEFNFDSLQHLLAWFLGASPHMGKLVALLSTSLSHQDADEKCTFEKAASLVFEGLPKDTASEALDGLIRLGSMALPNGEGVRRPLLDIRYHQLLRGIRDVGITLRHGLEGQMTFSLHPGSSEESDGLSVFGLGLCRACGQPFALGYGQQVEISTSEKPIARHPGAGFKYLHAFAWTEGRLPPGAEDEPQARDEDIWLNTTTGLVKRSTTTPPGSGWFQVWWHRSGTKDHPEFIARCPCCQEKQDPKDGARFGVITPYEAARTQVRRVVLDELIRMVEPSLDPVARRQSGEGRKLLAFSDSRREAASLAWGYQDFFKDVVLNRLVTEAIRNSTDVRSMDIELRNEFEQNHPHFSKLRSLIIAAEDEPTITLEKIQKRRELLWQDIAPDIQLIAGSLVRILHQHGCSRLLEISGSDGEDLDEHEAARFLLLQGVSSGGRHSLRAKGLIEISSKTLSQQIADESAWQMRASEINVPSDALAELSWRMHEFLLKKVRVKCPSSWPYNSFNRYKGVILHKGKTGLCFLADTTRDFSPTVEVVATWMVEYGSKVSFLWDLVRDQLRQKSGIAGDYALVRDWAVAASNHCLAQLGQLAIRPEKTSKKEWACLLAESIIPPGAKVTKAAQQSLHGLLGKAMDAVARRILGKLWSVFAAGSQPILKDDENGFMLCFDDLVLQSLASSKDKNVTSGPWENELANREQRPVVYSRIEEHTAQISSSKGSAYQRAFASGGINILSCSTTFEMGVDLGDLSCVFLSNLPPAMANYRQRAGRAGRRPGAASYVLTVVGDGAHDRHYWEKPGTLLFGEMDTPKIYLENKILVSRHLRAEAFHDFLRWMHEGRLDCVAKNADGNVIGNHQRNWRKLSDFFLGKRSGRRKKGENDRAVSRRFDPMVDALGDWHEARLDLLQDYVGRIADVENAVPDYKLADDFVWQVQDQGVIRPFSLDEKGAYKALSGPKQPDAPKSVESENPSRREVEYRIKKHWKQLAGDSASSRINNLQLHLMHEFTIDWLANHRVLPKYGFPVDVIRLLPEENDFAAKDVKLERDLKIGIYEYAPGQQVIADKRVFEAAAPVVFQGGGLQNAIDYSQKKWLCDVCDEPDQSGDIIASGEDDEQSRSCIHCGGPLVPVTLVRPDAFQAKKSKSASGFDERAQRGTSVQVHSGALKDRILVPQTSLLTAESESGVIRFINRGPGSRGFDHFGKPYSLYHEVRTDIAGWIPHSSLFDRNELLGKWKSQVIQSPGRQQARDRLTAAMHSALQAILRAAAIELQIDTREIGGLVYPDHQAGGGFYGFVLYDESPGGSGAVMDLCLSGQSSTDSDRVEIIRRILRRALELCEQCPECNKQHPFAELDQDKMPVSRQDYLNLQRANDPRLQDYRVQQSCYQCLRSYQNQRHHHLYDRSDAALLIRRLLAAS